MKLVKASDVYKKEIEDFRNEMIAYNSSFDGCSNLEKYEDIDEWLKFVDSVSDKNKMPKDLNWVEGSEWLFVDDNKRIYGMLNARHELNDFLMDVGGNIGYCIRPTERRKGYAKEQLRLGLEIYRRMGVNKVLLTCDKDNIGSKKTITDLGGIFEDEKYSDIFECIIQRYWIPLKKIVNGKEYEIIRYLGKGKGGYSYLAKYDDKFYTLKQIHHEPCEYYTFGNKIEAEKNDYKRIADVGIRIPRLLEIDEINEIIIKDYIDGPTIKELIDENHDVSKYIPQVREMAHKCYQKHLNIDYYPTNFIVCNDMIYYIDYECNQYSEQWNFENWGEKTWEKQK